MKLINGILVIFSIYSRLPLPQPNWKKEYQTYALCFFPLVGLVLGSLQLLWYWLAHWFAFDDILFAGVATALPIFFTGGIHMDGFCDTVDGLSSYAPQEKKLEILKDPNAGAFAVIYAIIYFLLYFVLLTQINAQGIFLFAAVFTLSRSLCMIKMITEPSARPDGMAGSLMAETNKREMLISAILFSIIASIFVLWIYPLPGIALLVTVLCFYFSFRQKAFKEFGGVTGDLLGYFIIKCELYSLIAIVMMEGVLNRWSL